MAKRHSASSTPRVSVPAAARQSEPLGTVCRLRRTPRSRQPPQHLMPTCSATTPRAQVVHVHMAEAGGLHHGLQLGLAGVHADRFGQVAVAVAVARDQLPDARQHVERIPVVGLCQRRGDLRELQHQQPAAGLEHAVHLGQRLVLVRHVAQAESHADQVEAVVGEGQVSRRRRPAWAAPGLRRAGGRGPGAAWLR